MATTLAQLRVKVNNYASGLGDNYILPSQLADQLIVINDRYVQFCEETRYLFDDKISFTLVVNTDAYNLRNTSAFTKRMLEVTRVMINGAFILQGDVTSAPAVNQAYLTSAASIPAVWWMQPPKDLILWPKPDAVYSNSYVSGWYLPSDLSAESDQVEIEDVDVDALAWYIARSLIVPGKVATKEIAQVITVMNAMCDSRMKELRLRSAALYNGLMRRRSTMRAGAKY